MRATIHPAKTQRKQGFSLKLRPPQARGLSPPVDMGPSSSSSSPPVQEKQHEEDQEGKGDQDQLAEGPRTCRFVGPSARSEMGLVVSTRLGGGMGLLVLFLAVHGTGRSRISTRRWISLRVFRRFGDTLRELSPCSGKGRTTIPNS